MKFIFVCTVALGLFGVGSLFAQHHEDPDMTAYRIRNAGGVPGWVPQDGIGPAMIPATNKPTPTGATIGGIPNDGNYSPWGSSGNVIRNNNYNPANWWRDLLNTPPGSQISWGNHNYYYHDGNFFNAVNGIYQVVLPVLGLLMNTLPTSATSVPGYNNYYSYHDIYYYNTGNGYRVVAPPVGACLSNLPYFAQPVMVDGISCYKYDNVYIKPSYESNGNICYQVIGDVY